MRRILAAMMVSAIAALAATTPAHAGARGWYPSPKISYYDQSGYADAVDEAAREWSAAASPIRLTRVKDRRRADIIVSRAPRFGFTHHGSYRFRPAGKGGPGTVRLSREEFDDMDSLVEQADVAAHEFGHALGLGHGPGRCNVMYWRSQTWDCKARGARYRCGPGPVDVRRLAALWHFRARITRRTGYCDYTPPAAELTEQDPPELTLPVIEDPSNQRQITVYLRNRSAHTWGRDLLVVPVDEQGRYRDNGCIDGDGAFVGFQAHNYPVAPGGVAEFSSYVCGEPMTSGVFRFCMSVIWISPVPVVFGSMYTVTVHVPDNRVICPCWPPLPAGSSCPIPDPYHPAAP